MNRTDHEAASPCVNKAFDDVTGKELDYSKVMAARIEELNEFDQEGGILEDTPGGMLEANRESPDQGEVDRHQQGR